MVKVFKTVYEDQEIIKEMLFWFTNDEFIELLDKEIILQHLCKIKKFRNTINERKVIIKKACSLSIKNKILKQKIIDIWSKRFASSNPVINKLKEKDSITCSKLTDTYNKTEMLEFCTILWRDKLEKFNIVADEIYVIYKNMVNCDIKKEFGIEIKNNSESGGKIMDNEKNLFEMTLQQCIERITNVDNELKIKNDIINEQQETIKRLEAKIDNITDTKNIKKEMTNISKKMAQFERTIETSKKEFKEDINVFNKDNNDIKLSLSDGMRELKKINLNKVIKDINEQNHSNMKNIENNLNKVLENINIKTIESIENQFNIVLDKVINKIEESNNKVIEKENIDVNEVENIKQEKMRFFEEGIEGIEIDNDDFEMMLDKLKF